MLTLTLTTSEALIIERALATCARPDSPWVVDAQRWDAAVLLGKIEGSHVPLEIVR